MRAPPRLQTARLDLRPPVAEDFAATMALLAEPDTARFLGRSDRADHFLRFCRGAGSWLLYGYGTFILRPRGSGRVIGNCGIFHSWRGLGADFDDLPEAGWILGVDHVGQGLAREAMEAVLEWFDAAHSRRVMCMIEQGNDRSMRLAGRLGFMPMREAALPDGAGAMLLERNAAGVGS